MTDDLEGLMAHVEGSGHAFLSAIGPAVVAATALEICADTRSFARIFEVAHALVIRECMSLQEDLGLVTTEDRGEKSLRKFISLTEAGWATVARNSLS